LFAKFLDSLSVQEIQQLNWILTFVLVFISLVILLPALFKVIQRWRLLQKIQSLGKDSLHYVNLPDGLGGHLFYEHLLLTKNGIVIYTLARYRGNVFAAEKIDIWTQVENNRSYKFPNPLIELESKKVALKALIRKVPIQTGILVARNVDFPKGKPENVHLLNTLAPANNEEINPEYHDAWIKLKKTGQPLSENERNIYIDKEEQNTYWGRFLFAGLLLLLALVLFLNTHFTF